MKKYKILFILDKTNNNRNTKQYLDIITYIKHYYNTKYEFTFESFNPEDVNSFYDPELLQLYHDEYAINIINNNEYDLIITEGFSAYFWLLSPYIGNLVIINPILKPWEFYNSIINDKYIEKYKNIYNNRGLFPRNTWCILSNDEIFIPYYNEYNKILKSLNGHSVKKSNYSIKDIDKFFSIDSLFDKILNDITNNNIINNAMEDLIEKYTIDSKFDNRYYCFDNIDILNCNIYDCTVESVKDDNIKVKMTNHKNNFSVYSNFGKYIFDKSHIDSSNLKNNDIFKLVQNRKNNNMEVILPIYYNN